MNSLILDLPDGAFWPYTRQLHLRGVLVSQESPLQSGWLEAEFRSLFVRRALAFVFMLPQSSSLYLVESLTNLANTVSRWFVFLC